MYGSPPPPVGAEAGFRLYLGHKVNAWAAQERPFSGSDVAEGVLAAAHIRRVGRVGITEELRRDVLTGIADICGFLRSRPGRLLRTFILDTLSLSAPEAGDVADIIAGALQSACGVTEAQTNPPGWAFAALGGLALIALGIVGLRGGRNRNRRKPRR